MNLFFCLVVTIMVGVIGGYMAKKLKFIPAAYMIGALFSVLIFNLTTEYTYFPFEIRIFTQALAGMFLGSRINRKDLLVIKSILPSLLLLMVFFSLLTAGLGSLLHIVGGLDIQTALYASAPGGASDIGIIADAVGADAGTVTLLQLIRLITVFLYYPFLFSLFERKRIIHTKRNETVKLEKPLQNEKKALRFTEKIRGTLVVLVVSGIGATLGYVSNLPAGTMVFAMLFSVACNFFYKKTYFPRQFTVVAQLLSGVYLGLQITRENLAAIPGSMDSVVIVILSVVVLPLVFGYLIHKMTKLDLATAFFASTTGGMAEMTLLADDMGLDVVKVSVSHLVRVMMVVAVFPYLINFITKFFG